MFDYAVSATNTATSMTRMLATVVLAAISASATARADVPPNNSSGCRKKAPGYVCLTDDYRIGRCSEVEVRRGRPMDGVPVFWTEKRLLCDAPPLAVFAAAGLAAVATVIAVVVRRRRRSRPAAHEGANR